MKRILFLILIFVSAPTLFAKQQIKIGVAEFPPYAYAAQNGQIKGIEVDILRTCFKDSNFILDFVYMPYGRLPMALKSRAIDAQITTLPNKSSELYFSSIVAPEYHEIGRASCRERVCMFV